MQRIYYVYSIMFVVLATTAIVVTSQYVSAKSFIRVPSTQYTGSGIDTATQKHDVAAIIALQAKEVECKGPERAASRDDFFTSSDLNSYMVQVLAKSSPAELAGTRIMYNCLTSSCSAQSMYNVWSKYKVGGFIVNKSSVSGVKSLQANVARAQAAAGKPVVPLLIAMDTEPNIAVGRKNGLSSNLVRDSKKLTESRARQLGTEIGARAKRLGVNVAFGTIYEPPTVKFLDKIGRAFKSPSVAKAYSQGLAGSGLLAVAKHWPGHKADATDPHRNGALPASDFSSKFITLTGGTPVDGGVMLAHATVGGTHVSQHTAVLNKRLRGSTYAGLVFTDAFNMRAAGDPVAAVHAGVDILLMPQSMAPVLSTLMRDVKDLATKRGQQAYWSAARVMKMRIALGMAKYKTGCKATAFDNLKGNPYIGGAGIPGAQNPQNPRAGNTPPTGQTYTPPQGPPQSVRRPSFTPLSGQQGQGSVRQPSQRPQQVRRPTQQRQTPKPGERPSQYKKYKPQDRYKEPYKPKQVEAKKAYSASDKTRSACLRVEGGAAWVCPTGSASHVYITDGKEEVADYLFATKDKGKITSKRAHRGYTYKVKCKRGGAVQELTCKRKQ